MSRANGITRQQILTSLKQKGAMTADDLHKELGISQVAVRQHLSSLEAENIISISVERRGLGRPSHRYRLTPVGDENFPRRYEILSKELIEELRDWQGEEAVHELVSRRTDRQVMALRHRISDGSQANALEEVTRFQNENGFMAEVIPGNEPGTFRLVQHNCAICAIAREYPQFTCEQERQMLSQLLGCAEVVREKHILDGDHVCTYRIRTVMGATDEGDLED